MGLETGTKLSDLVTTNPTSSDPRSQGDDHLRLIKTVLATTQKKILFDVTTVTGTTADFFTVQDWTLADGRMFLEGFDYLYDAAGGYVGYGWNGRVSHEYGGVTPGTYGTP